ncbi:MAG: hypothetical protein H7Y31_10955 [Chitinophagaceae bacterium]|nr:hypothetical protein [Chitinophagaceae bacterium]
MKRTILNRLLLVLIIALTTRCVYSQGFNKVSGNNDNFLQLAEKTNRFYDTARGSNRSGYKQWNRFAWFAINHLNEDGTLANYAEKNTRALTTLKQMEAASVGAGTNSVTGAWINIGHSFSIGNQAQQGRVNSVAFDPLNGDVVYVASAAGGIWKSSNGGSNWANLTIDLPILGIADIAVAPAPNNNIVYALSGEGLNANIYFHKGIGILKSTNGGLDWQSTGPVNRLDERIGGNKLLIHPSNADYVLAAMSNGVWRTTNGGAEWTNIFGGDVNDIEFKPSDPNTLYLVTRNSNRLFQMNLTTLVQSSVAIVAPATPPTNAPNVNRMEIGVSAANGNAVYVLAGPGYVSGGNNLFYGLYYSSNSGTSFSLRSNRCSANGDLFNSASEFAWYANMLYVSPFNENNVIIGGLNLFSSYDGGVTLNQIVDPNIHADQHNIKRSPSSGDLWLCNDGGVYKSINSGVSWDNSSAGLVINEYYRISGTQTSTDNLIGGLQDNGHFLRGPGTNVFFSTLGGDGMDNFFNSFDNNIVYASSQNGGLARSTDGGFNFVPTALPNLSNRNFFPWITPIVQHPPNVLPPFFFNNLDVLYAYSLNGVMRSVDGGTNWANIGPAGIGQAAGALTPAMAAASNDLGANVNLYISNGNNFWVHSTPLTGNAAGWVNRPLPISAFSNTSAIAVNPSDRNEVWVTISGYNAGEKVFRSTNAGATWTNMSQSLPNTPVYSIVFANNSNNPGGAVYIGTEIGVFYRDNNLANWVPFSNGLPHVPVTDLQMNYVNGTLKAGTYGRGIWQSDLFQYCTPTLNINYVIYQGQYNFEASNTITANQLIFGGIGTRVTMKAGTRVRLLPGFKASGGSYTRIGIGNCGTGPLAPINDSLSIKTDSTTNGHPIPIEQ